MTNPKNREELDEYKELSSSEEELLSDTQLSAAEATDKDKKKCIEGGGTWKEETHKCVKGVDQSSGPDIASELETQTDITSSEEERLQDNQPSTTEATEKQKCPEGQVWNSQTRKCEESSDPGGEPAL
jgi:hypothetical protein